MGFQAWLTLVIRGTYLLMFAKQQRYTSGASELITRSRFCLFASELCSIHSFNENVLYVTEKSSIERNRVNTGIITPGVHTELSIYKL